MAPAAGSYTMIVSSFEPAVESRFSIDLRASLPINVNAIPPEGAGLFKRTVSGAW